MSEHQRVLRDALGTFATGLTIVTTVSASGERLGITVNSFSSISLEPLLILFSIACNVYSQKSFLESGRYMINVLSEEKVPPRQLRVAKQTGSDVRHDARNNLW